MKWSIFMSTTKWIECEMWMKMEKEEKKIIIVILKYGNSDSKTKVIKHMKKEKYGKCLNWMKYSLHEIANVYGMMRVRNVELFSAHIWNPMYPIMFVCSVCVVYVYVLYDITISYTFTRAKWSVLHNIYAMPFFLISFFHLVFVCNKGPNVPPTTMHHLEKFPFRCRRVFERLNAWKLECSIEFHFLYSFGQIMHLSHNSNWLFFSHSSLSIGRKYYFCEINFFSQYGMEKNHSTFISIENFLVSYHFWCGFFFFFFFCCFLGERT